MCLADVDDYWLCFLRPECFNKHVLPVLCFCECDFQKVENVIHTQEHMLSSHSALLHPHNTCCHACSCHLLPVCLPISVTCCGVHLKQIPYAYIRHGWLQKQCVLLFLHSVRKGKNKQCTWWQAIPAALVCGSLSVLKFVTWAVMFSTVLLANLQSHPSHTCQPVCKPIQFWNDLTHHLSWKIKYIQQALLTSRMLREGKDSICYYISIMILTQSIMRSEWFNY